MKIMKYDAGSGELKNWLIQESSFDERYLGKCEAIFAQGNGYLGVRNALEEAYTGEVRNTFLTGTFNKASKGEVTELPNLPDMTGVTITIDGHQLNLSQGQLQEYSRTLNLKNGEVVRKISWVSPTGVGFKAEFKRIVSLAEEHTMACSIDFSVNQDVQVILETGVDGSVTNSGAQHFEEISRRIYGGRDMEYLSQTTESKVWIAQHGACSLNAPAAVLPVMGRRTLTNRYTIQAGAGKNVHFEKISVFHSSRDQKYVDVKPEEIKEILKKDGMKVLRRGFIKGYEGLKQESTEKWKKYWEESDIQIQGDADFDQLAVRFALYHLNIMVKHDDNRVGIGAKALTGEGYKGHSFWDTEMFILPYFTFTRPETARTLLEYRYRNLYGAHLKAKEQGYEGAMYPWECAWVDDGEVTPLYMGADVVTGKITKCWTGIIEHHISADISYAVEQYYLVTGDQDYMNQCGYEIILDTALFWASRVEYNQEKDRYEILDVIGPDEYKEHVDNNAYTNYMAAYNMKQALKIMEELPKENPEVYKRLDEKLSFSKMKEKIENCIHKLYLPVPNEDGIIPQSDQFLNLKKLDLTKYKESKEVLTIYKDFNTEQLNQYMVSKQADTVMLLFLLDTLFDEEIKKKNFIFYEDKTLHDSSLSKSTHAILANDFGLQDMAYDLYERALKIDLGPQMKSSDEGIHSASTGGIWESTVMGFGGVRMEGEHLRIAPKLPQKWNKLVFSLRFKGEPLKVEVEKDVVLVENRGKNQVFLLIGKEFVNIPAGHKVQKPL